MLSFYTPWKNQKTTDFLCFQGTKLGRLMIAAKKNFFKEVKPN